VPGADVVSVHVEMRAGLRWCGDRVHGLRDVETDCDLADAEEVANRIADTDEPDTPDRVLG
jgi:hypothetical protein